MSNLETREGRRVNLRLSARKRLGYYAISKDIYFPIIFKVFMQNKVKA
ncbi:hypothetical protein [Mucilaginibacter flavus]|nr:hypothetical protein [Mucilaginibacter flavus]